jgi:hypothetical protein
MLFFYQGSVPAPCFVLIFVIFKDTAVPRDKNRRLFCQKQAQRQTTLNTETHIFETGTAINAIHRHPKGGKGEPQAVAPRNIKPTALST